MLWRMLRTAYYNGIMLLLGLATEVRCCHVNDYDSLINEFLEDLIHHCLEISSYSEAKEHD